MTMKAAFFKANRPGLKALYNMFVRFWTGGPYSHMVIIFSDGITGTSTFLEGGVYLSQETYLDGQWDYITLPDNLESSVRVWFEAHKGNAYDWNANLRFILGFIPEPKNKYDCSSACLSALGYTQTYRFDPNAAYSVITKLVS